MARAARNVILGPVSLYLAPVSRCFRLFSQRVDFRCSARLSILRSVSPVPFSDSRGGRYGSRENGEKRRRLEQQQLERRSEKERERERENVCRAPLHKSAITKPAAAISRQLPFPVINSPNSWPRRQLECSEPRSFLTSLILTPFPRDVSRLAISPPLPRLQTITEGSIVFSLKAKVFSLSRFAIQLGRRWVDRCYGEEPITTKNRR